MRTARYYSCIRRAWPLYEYRVWEKIIGHRSELIFEGVALRKKTAERKAKEIIAHMEKDS